MEKIMEADDYTPLAPDNTLKAMKAFVEWETWDGDQPKLHTVYLGAKSLEEAVEHVSGRLGARVLKEAAVSDTEYRMLVRGPTRLRVWVEDGDGGVS